MGALKDLWNSERGLLSLVGLLCITVMFGLGRITDVQWDTDLKWIFAFYVGGKTATSVAETLIRPKMQSTPDLGNLKVSPSSKTAPPAPSA